MEHNLKDKIQENTIENTVYEIKSLKCLFHDNILYLIRENLT